MWLWTALTKKHTVDTSPLTQFEGGLHEAEEDAVQWLQHS